MQQNTLISLCLTWINKHTGREKDNTTFADVVKKGLDAIKQDMPNFKCHANTLQANVWLQMSFSKVNAHLFQIFR